MKFSIIIPCYNSEKYIQECLESVFNQTLSKSEYEVIVINDGSTDNSDNIIKSYPVISLYTDRRKAGGARNKGIDNAKGDYIIFLDSDDTLYCEDCLENLYKFIKDEDIIYLPLVTTNTLTGEVETRRANPSITIQEMLKSCTLLGPAYRCINREKLGHIHFTEDVYYEDVLYALKIICEAKTFAYFEQEFYRYRKHDNSMTHSAFSIEKQLDFISESAKMIKLAVKYPEYHEAIMERMEKINIYDRIQKVYEELKE